MGDWDEKDLLRLGFKKGSLSVEINAHVLPTTYELAFRLMGEKRGPTKHELEVIADFIPAEFLVFHQMLITADDKTKDVNFLSPDERRFLDSLFEVAQSAFAGRKPAVSGDGNKGGQSNNGNSDVSELPISETVKSKPPSTDSRFIAFGRKDLDDLNRS